MKPNSLLGAAVAAVILSGMSLIAAMPVQAVTTGPTVIAVHRDGAVDVPGNSFGPVAKMTLPAGNWSITATGTLQGTDISQLGRMPARRWKGAVRDGGGALRTGSWFLCRDRVASCPSLCQERRSDPQLLQRGLTGDVLIRDLHMTAVQVGQLTDNAGTFGTGSPRASLRKRRQHTQLWLDGGVRRPGHLSPGRNVAGAGNRMGPLRV